MKIRSAVRRAWEIYTRSLGDSMLMVLLECALRLMVAVPLLFLFTQNLKPLALLSVPLFFLVVPPARANAAEVMQAACRGSSLFSKRLVVSGHYWSKVGQGIRMAFFLLLWSLPLIAVTLWLVRIYSGETIVGQTDFITLLTTLQNLGSGDLVRGTYFALAIYACFFLPVLFGMAFHSGRRHELALGDKRFLRGRRGAVLCCWLVGLVVLIPFLLMVVWLGSDYLRRLVAALNDFSGGLHLPKPTQRIYLVAGAFVVLCLPLLPFRSLITACLAHSLWEGRE